MTIFTEGSRKAQFMVSEANDWRSRDEGVVTVPAETTFAAGMTLGRQTTGLKFVRHDANGTDDGRRVVAGVLFAPIVNATDGAVDYPATVLMRDAEVSASDLTYEDGANAAAIVTSNAALAALGIVAR